MLFIIVTAIVLGIILLILKLVEDHKKRKAEKEYKELESKVLNELHAHTWNELIPFIDKYMIVKSRQALEKYDATKFFKEDKNRLNEAEQIIIRKDETATRLKEFSKNNIYQVELQYDRIQKNINNILKNAKTYRICVEYVSSAGNHLAANTLEIRQDTINKFKSDPSLLMSKGEYNKYLKQQQKEMLDKKQHQFYEDVNHIIDFANKSRDNLIVKGSQERLDLLMANLFDKTINSIKKIKTLNSEEWDIVQDLISHIKKDAEDIINLNEKILTYYDSPEFAKVKESCKTLMDSQRDFNTYIMEKVETVSHLFGTRIVRNETVNKDEYEYIRPYKKTITPFTAEVSATVFASAENNPLDYVVKYFYPNKKDYPEQIAKLYQLVEELETLKDAKEIIENHKVEYKQFLSNVPSYVIENDKTGFYSKLGFANIDESVLNVEYKFIYTSGGGMAQRFFTIPMTEENIAELIKKLENKLTSGAFVKEQRNLMTKKLREHIKKRDNYTCCTCGNSIQAEPNLLLEIDHIIPVSKGGCTIEDNLQTLCWKCNRSKSNKILS